MTLDRGMYVFAMIRVYTVHTDLIVIFFTCSKQQQNIPQSRHNTLFTGSYLIPRTLER